MIIKGNPGGSVAFWSSHLLRDDTNEKAEVKEITGLTAEDLPGALREMQAVASGSRSHGNFMYQANISPRADEHLTPAQWREAVDTLEKNLGLEGHQRVVVEHVKEGRQHYHVVWNRVDVETMKVADMGGNYRVHESTARELEAKFELTPTPTRPSAERQATPELWEMRAAARTGIDPHGMKAELTALWQSCDSGQAFAAALDERGFVLARGDRRDFCVVDSAGTAHSLARRLDGVKAAEVRDFMADVDRDGLPSVAEARAEQRSHGFAAEQDHAKEFAGSFAEPAAETPPVPDRAAVHDHSPAFDASGPDVGPVAERGALMVADALAGTVEKLADFMADFFVGGPPPRPERADQVQRLLEQRRAPPALENIRESVNDGKAIARDDLLSLTPGHLLEIKTKGDDYVHRLISNLEAERAATRNQGRERDW